MQNNLIDKDWLGQLGQEDTDKLIVKISLIDKILNSPNFFTSIPYFVNHRSTQTNINLIKTVLAILVKQIFSL